MNDFYKIIGKNIEKYRKLKGISAEELGNRVGLTKKTIRRYETRRDNNHIPKSIDISMFERHVLLRRAKFVQNYFQLLSHAKMRITTPSFFDGQKRAYSK